MRFVLGVKMMLNILYYIYIYPTFNFFLNIKHIVGLDDVIWNLKKNIKSNEYIKKEMLKTQRGISMKRKAKRYGEEDEVFLIKRDSVKG